MSIPSDLRYTAEHEWLSLAGDIATVGITDFAARALGDIVYLQAPAVGTSVTAGEACGEVESTKSVSDLYAPATGEITEVNAAVVEDPALVNSDPFGAGWLFRLRVTELPALLDAAAYGALSAGEAGA
jgi:glycine cleavage system H protein